MRHKDDPEQKLVDISFAMVLTVLDSHYNEAFMKMTQEEKANWVRKQLRGCGFQVSDPVGVSWGVLE